MARRAGDDRLMDGFDIGFSGNPLDRLSERRDDSDFIAALAADPNARAVVFVQSMPILRAEGDQRFALHPLAQARTFGAVQVEVLLGRDAGGPVFALLLADDAARAEGAADPAAFVDQRRLILPRAPALTVRDLRALGQSQALDRASLSILAQAKSILHYHATHPFCARCGAPTIPSHAGWRRDCPACGAQHFPRTDPVAIMLVTQGEDCLLGRQKRFPTGMYSCLAGFVESGETLEEAVRREVLEESGIRVGAVHYVASQPWPFPANLMLGCLAEARSRDIVMDAVELEDCRWFSRAEARAMIGQSHAEGFFAPASFAIARLLLNHWLSLSPTPGSAVRP
jgi:NAD+ diphosphatase